MGTSKICDIMDTVLSSIFMYSACVCAYTSVTDEPVFPFALSATHSLKALMNEWTEEKSRIKV